MALAGSEISLKLLIAVKGVAQENKAFRQGELIARVPGVQTTLLMVIQRENQRSQAEADLAKAAEMLAPLQVGKLIRMGNPAEEIIRESGSGSYDLVVIGERPVNFFLEPLLTHTVERVVREMPCPMLVARPRSRPLRRFLLCEGGRSTGLLPAVTGRLEPLTRTAEKIVVLHVMSQITARPGVQGWELRADADQLIGQHTPEGARLQYDLEFLHRLNVDLDVKVRHGVVVEEILAEASSGDYDVIVLGRPVFRNWQRYLMDDPVHKIIIHGERPVLVI